MVPSTENLVIIIQLSFLNSMMTCVKARHHLVLYGCNLVVTNIAFHSILCYTQ